MEFLNQYVEEVLLDVYKRQAIVFGFMLYFTSLSLILYPIGIENASRYSPYELAFSRIFDKNNIDDEDIKNIMEANDIDITAKKEIRFVRNNAINIIDVYKRQI